MTTEQPWTRARPEVLPEAEWVARAGGFEEVERHATCGAGDLLVVRDAEGLAAVEQPERGQRLLRRFPDEEALRRFVDERLAQYERMWNGCGCRIDYFA